MPGTQDCWRDCEARSRHLRPGDRRQPLSRTEADGWSQAFDKEQNVPAVDVDGEEDEDEELGSPAPMPSTANATQSLLRCVSAAALVQRDFGEAWNFLPEVHTRSLLCKHVGRKAAELANYIADRMGELAEPPPPGNRSAALLFLGILVTTCQAGRGVAMLIRNLLFQGSLASMDATGALDSSVQQGLPFPPDLVFRFLDAVRVLFRHAECGEEVQAVHDVIEAELERYGMLPPKGQQQQAADQAAAPVLGPGDLPLTAEQLTACRLHFWDDKGKPITTILQAFAGAGKSFVLRQIVRDFPGQFFTYVVYNKDAQEAALHAMDADYRADHAAGRRTVRNYDVRTTHSLSLSCFGVRQRYPGRALGDLTNRSVREFLARHWRLDDRFVHSIVAAAVTRTLSRYMASADKELGKAHLGNDVKQLATADEAASNMLWRRDGVTPKDLASRPPHPDYKRGMLVDAARALWKLVAAEGPGSVHGMKLPFNACVKAFALSDEKLAVTCNGRRVVLLVDEAQDLNAVTKQILLDKQELPVVLVGDRWQQLYSFNYACGLMSGRQHIPRLGRELSLSQTFRFGREIAAVINTDLKAAYLEPRYLVGRPLPSHDGTGHPGVVYALVPRRKDLQSVLPADLQAPIDGGKEFTTVACREATGRRRLGMSGSGTFRGMRYVQCPLRCTAPDTAFPAEWEVLPISGVALVPPGFQLPPGVAGARCPALPLLTFVARTKPALVKAALELVQAGRSVCGSFGGKDWLAITSKLRNVVDFLQNHKRFPPGHELHGLTSERELEQLVEAETGTALATAYTLAQEYTLQEVEELGTKLVSDRHAAEYYLVTAHKMKGDEAPMVQVAEDYLAALAPSNDSERDRLHRLRGDSAMVDELNCVYVAATRARAVLLLNRDLSRLVLGLHRTHVELVLPDVCNGRSDGASGAADGVQVASTVVEQERAGAAAADSACAAGSRQQVEDGEKDELPGCSGDRGAEAQPVSQFEAAGGARLGTRRSGQQPREKSRCGAAASRGGDDSRDKTYSEAGVSRHRSKRAASKRGREESGSDGEGGQKAPVKEVKVEQPAADGKGKKEEQQQPVPTLLQAPPQAGRSTSKPLAPSCSVCSKESEAHPQAHLLPRVTWRERPVCRGCARRTVWGEVLNLAEAALAAQQPAGGQGTQQ